MFSTDKVAEHLGLSAGDKQRDYIPDAVAAVIMLIGQWTDYGYLPDTWPPNITLGATMLAARMHRRRNSPAGVEQFTDMGPVYVSRSDPDIAQLLGLGAWTRPRVG